jgi:hypothetical protein
VPAKLDALRRIPAWLGRHAYLGVAAAALLIITRTVDFAPPAEVRKIELPAHDAEPAPTPAPAGEFREAMSAEEGIQLRATLRLLENADDVAAGAQDDATAGRVLAQPVVATLLGVPAEIDTTVRVDGGDLEIRVALDVTPRERSGDLTLDSDLEVTSRRRDGDSRPGPRRLHLRSSAVLSDLAAHPHKLLFTVEGRLFALDVDAHKP